MNTINSILDKDVFKDRLNLLRREGETFANANPEPEEYAEFLNNFKDWEARIFDFFQRSFQNQNNYFYQYLKQHKFVPRPFSNIPGLQPPPKKAINDKKESARILIYNVDYCSRMISILDGIWASSFPVDRSKYNVNEKLLFTLDRLYHLNDGSFYPIEFILFNSGVKLNHGEARELSGKLESKGYIECLGGLGSEMMVKITVDGSLTVESINVAYKENYSKIPQNKDDINRIIEEIIDNLSLAGINNVIIAEELQVLKSLFGDLDKKCWGQLLKGKLIDLKLSNDLSIDEVKSIYKEITKIDLMI